MKTILFSLLCLVSSCAMPDKSDPTLAKGLSPKRQKQKISALQKKLETAASHELLAKEHVQKLRSEIEEAELTLVRKAICNTGALLNKLQEDPNGASKRAKIDVSTLFFQEREILQRLVESGPSPAALEAQGLLDQMLRIITNLSDEPTPISLF